ncbi:helix-turn-helix domain-containing protein [Flavobacterium sp. GA093]|uniref:Helix-turn-helix domain-containing protein n=1 Tax=Flavobacterium hydrocarbonoxydans TaxID=2683249 RepID=A0A6I4NM97_9FLAO|nr:AraC family transcriptional regulator [Flavobacterium hydrocarbonoxydans]MWB93695.1 helix-turn-helix domain-containing protein [Flavobacterium hydrocarbonoxydans]
MDKINLLLIVTIISLFISLFLAFFLLTVKTKHKTSNSLFAFFLIITAIDFSTPLVELITNGPSTLGMLRNTSAFLQIPAFYLYVLSVCYSDFRLKPKYILHLLPFLLVNIILLPRFYLVDAAAKLNFIVHRQSMIEIPTFHILFHIQILVYFVAVFMLLKRAKKLYLENYAGTNINSYNWLFQFTVVLCILYSITLFKNIFKFSEYSDLFEWMKIGIIAFQLFIACWYLFKALNHPGLFRNIDSNLKLVSDIILEEKNNSALAANEKEYNEELIKLKQFMAEEKPFLNPSLTIQDVSAAIKVPVRDVSLLINHKLEQHFYDFVNTYRIEHAMAILNDPSKSKVTILEILYEVGFNSKSSFNTAFKKHTGNTPTSYRKLL